MGFPLRKEFAPNPDFRTPPVAHEVPLSTVRHNVYVLTDGTLVAVFRVNGMEYDLASQQDTVVFCERLRSIYNAVPPKVQIKFLHRITHNYGDLLREHEGVLDGDNVPARYLAWDQLRRFRRAMTRGQVLRSDNLFVVAYNPRVAWWEAPSKIDALKEAALEVMTRGPVQQRTIEQYARARGKFEDMLSGVHNQMRLAGLDPERLDNEGLHQLAWEVLNPEESLERECPKIVVPRGSDPYAGIFATGAGKTAAEKNPDVTVVAPISEREQLCASDWQVKASSVRIGAKHYGAVYLRMLPTEVYPSLAEALAGISFECTVSIDAVMLSKEKELQKQWSTARSEEGKAGEDLFGGTPDPAKAEAASELRQRYLQLQAAHQNPFALRMVVVVSGATEEELKQRCNAVITILRNMEGAQGVREQFAVDTLIKTTWPFFPITSINSRKATTTQVASLIPAFARWAGSKRPVTLLMDPMGRLVKHDPFPSNQLNRNKTLCGKSGSGKSFAAQLMDIQPHCARKGTEVLIVESGGSFKLTTECFGGKYLKMGPSSDYQINPFDLPPGFAEMPDAEKQTELRYKYGFVKNLVMSMARIKDPQMQVFAENIIGTVAQRTYRGGQTPRFRDFYRLLLEYQNPRDPDAEKIAVKIAGFLRNYVVTPDGEAGIYSEYFDTYTNFDAEAPILCFDLMDVKNDPALLTPTAMVVIMGLIYNRLMKRDGTERVVIVDEAWALVKADKDGGQSAAGEGIELFWREGRKLGASSAMISQNYSDMTGDATGQAVVGNSPIQYFLVHERGKQNNDAFAEANFSAERTDRVYDLKTVYGEYSEILIKEGDEWGVVRLPSYGMKYWLATTDPKDDDVKRRYFDTYGGRYGFDALAVIAILAEDYPNGVHGPHGQEMGEQDALQFADRWMQHYQRFADLVAAGEPIPVDFE